jgi:Ca2+-binding RTX toxin-like protein
MRRIALIALATCVALAGAAAVPAAGLSAVLSYQDGVGLTYRAAPGEVNHLAMNPFAGPIEGVSNFSMTIEDTAPLVQVGDFCLPETPLRCPTVAMYAYMGDRSDTGVAAPYFRDAYIWGEGGNDDVSASGRYHAVAYGGAGDDRVSAGADGDAEAWGQAGDDVIRAGTQSSLHLYGGAGDDAITTLTATYAASVVDGGAGRDRIDVSLNGGCCLDILGRDGADTINAVSARSVNSGDGNDRVTAHGSVRSGAGDDRIDVSGNPDQSDAVSCGAGRDAVTADPGDSVNADCEAVTTVSAT